MSKINLTEYLSEKGEIILPIKGSSMLPFFRDNMLIKIRKVDRKIRKDDCVLYERESGEFVLHRIFKVNEQSQTFDLKGDALFTLERNVHISQIRGILEGFFVRKKYISVNQSHYRLKVFLWNKSYLVRKLGYKLFYKKERKI